MLMILVQQGRLGEARNLIEARWKEDGLSRPERLSLLHDHIALDFETMPLDGNLEFLGITSATESDDDGLWLARANLALKTGRLEESSRWLDAATVRRGDDQAVWRARLEWARASGRLDQAGEAMAHLKAAEFGDDEIAGLGAWIAERKGDVKAEKHALEQAARGQPRRPRGPRASGRAQLPGGQCRRRTPPARSQIQARRQQGPLPSAVLRRPARIERPRNGTPRRRARPRLRGPGVHDAGHAGAAGQSSPFR